MVGNWADDGSSRYSLTVAGGRLTFLGVRDERLPIDFAITVLIDTGGDKQVSGQIAVNGVVQAATKITTTASSTKTGTINLIWQHTFKTNDYIELFIDCETSSTNVIVQSSVLRVN